MSGFELIFVIKAYLKIEWLNVSGVNKRRKAKATALFPWDRRRQGESKDTM